MDINAYLDDPHRNDFYPYDPFLDPIVSGLPAMTGTRATTPYRKKPTGMAPYGQSSTALLQSLGSDMALDYLIDNSFRGSSKQPNNPRLGSGMPKDDIIYDPGFVDRTNQNGDLNAWFRKRMTPNKPAGNTGAPTSSTNVPALPAGASGAPTPPTNVSTPNTPTANPKFLNYNFKTGKPGGVGLSVAGKNIGKWANVGTGVMQGLDALSGLSKMADLNTDADSLESQILASAASNPLLSSYLTSDDLSLLGKLKRGSYEGSAGVGDAFSNIGNLLSGAGTGALTGAAGGLPGILIGAIGGAVNSGIDNMNSTTSQNTARLESLYQNLLDAEQQYKSMKRPNFTGLGIQQRYQNMYI